MRKNKNREEKNDDKNKIQMAKAVASLAWKLEDVQVVYNIYFPDKERTVSEKKKKKRRLRQKKRPDE